MSEKKENKYYSQTEIAKKLNVSQATISRLVRQKGITPVKGDAKTKKYSEKQLNQIAFMLSGKKERDASKEANDRLFTELKKEITDLQKDKEEYQRQIDNLNEQLKMAQINLNRSQQLQLEQAKKIKQLEAPASDNEKTTENKKAPTNEQEQEKSEKKSLWERLFGN